MGQQWSRYNAGEIVWHRCNILVVSYSEQCRPPAKMPVQGTGTYNTALFPGPLLYAHRIHTPYSYTPTRARQITQVLEQGQGMDLIEQVSSAGVTANNPLLPPPEKLFGFTYVSFFIEKTTFPASKHNAVMDLTTPTPNVGAFSAMTGTFNFDGKRIVHGTWGDFGLWVDLLLYCRQALKYAATGPSVETEENWHLP